MTIGEQNIFKERSASLKPRKLDLKEYENQYQNINHANHNTPGFYGQKTDTSSEFDLDDKVNQSY